MTRSEHGLAAIASETGLERAIGVRGLAATAINVVVGGGIFVLPAVVAASLGPSGPLAYIVVAAAMSLIVLCFAQAGSRVSLTGGPYAYVEIALGRYMGFLVGTLLWLVGTTATAAVGSAFVGSVAVFYAPLAAPVPRALILAGLFALFGALNSRGTRQSTRFMEIVTVAKLLPLLVFVVIGAALAHGSVPDVFGNLAPAKMGRSVIVLIFAFAGIEFALVPSGEVKDPARTVPRALFLAMIAITLLYVAIQYVAQMILGPALATAQAAPLTTAARVVLGPGFALFIGIGASISMFGYVSGMLFTAPRALYAFGRDGILPPVFAKLHPEYDTPVVAIFAQSTMTFLVAVTSGFTQLAILANISVLVLYLLCCISAYELRRRNVQEGGTPFRIPGGPLVPILAVAVILWILSNATLQEFSVIAGVLVAASVLFVIRKGAIAKVVRASS
ncbi:MAG: APC family permease [Gemmatimonadota bacterium]|nr:APC family permease [Gemmatimonadota bacterium]